MISNSGTKSLTLSILVMSFVLFSCSQNEELEWHQQQGYRWAELDPGYFGDTGFEKLSASDTDIHFINEISKENISENRNYLNGSGVAAADVDGDGWVDLYFAGLDSPNKLYKNMGRMEFKDITGEAGVAHEGYYSTGVVFADVNGDTFPDLLITSLTESNELYINDGNGKFNLKEDSGLGPSKGSNTLALSDIDGDEDLDLYITNYKLKTARDIYSAEELSTQNTLRKQGDSLVVVPPFDQYYGIIETDNRSYRNEYGESDELYINDGKGKFEKVEEPEKRFLDEQGRPKGLPRDWGLTARFQDINDDGLPDLYVANDFWTPDRFWINQGEGVFKQTDRNAIRSMSYSSMGIDFSDINRDGELDFFVTEMLSADHQRRMRQLSEHLDPINGTPQYNRNSMYLNRGDNTFAEISYFSGLEATEWSWATSFLDVDLDGYEDLVIATGHAYDYQDIDTQLKMDRQSGQSLMAAGDLFQYPRLELPNKIFRNNGDLTFSDKSADWGFAEEDISLGMAYADLDNDGDPDLAFNRLNQEATIFKNRSNESRIAVRLEGESANTKGIGAKVELYGMGAIQQKEIAAGGNYVSGSQPAAFFSADDQNSNHEIRVTWPDGTQSSIDSVKANRIYVIDKSSAGNIANENSPKKPSKTLFKDISGRIDHVHHEDPYTDTNIQAMLPAELSRQGPGISWIDFDCDGDDDLFVASGKGGSLAVFENIGDGRFRQLQQDMLNRQAPGDQTTMLGWTDDFGAHLIVGSANFEQGNPKAPSALHFTIDENQNIEMESLPGILSTTGPLAAADYDSDGDIDLFVGGSFKPAHYPEDATSRLFLYEDGSFQLDRPNSRILSEIGLVSAAVFTDYDRDGDQDLLISREWDSLVLLENDNGRFREVSSSVGLDQYKGWWKGVTTGDFNNDGLPDIVALNIGENSVYQLETESPLKLYYGNFNMDNSIDIIDSYYRPEIQAYVPRRKLYNFDSVPSILRNVNSHEEYASSSVEKIFGRSLEQVPSKEINTVKHMLFINTGDGFKAQPLPEWTQFSAAFHASVADFDNDGNEDLFLSQNKFTFPPEIPRQDAGRGLLLLGDGTGYFKAVPGQESGIKIYGEQRGASASDFNMDGKTDLAVTQNEGETKLYLNQVETAGLEIRLTGSSSNRNAVGSAIRPVYANGSKGPLREIRAGAGYWSQSGFTQIIGKSGKIDSIEIHWFNGTSEMIEISEENRIVVRFDGDS